MTCVQRSYRGVLVDEYQDSTIDQHRLILALAEVLPTRVVGDPLQGIYGFGDAPSVDFDTDVYPHFPPLDPLTTPWRWACNEELGADLQRVRERLLAGQEPSRADFSAIRVASDHPASLSAVCNHVAALGGTAVVLRSHAGQAHATASRSKGQFVSMEELEGRDILRAASKLQDADGPIRAAVLLDVLERCTTAVVPALKTQRQLYRGDQLPAVPKGKKSHVVSALNAVATTEDPMAIVTAIEAARDYPDVVVYRPEVLDDLAAAARRCRPDDEGTSLLCETRAVRDRGRRSGRQLADRVVSRTLLVKGLEFDHAIVCDLADMDACHMYVALTRAAKSVTIIPG